MTWRGVVLAACLAVLPGMPAPAVEPGEMLENPALEARARELSKELRCLVCRNESIDESNADLARELRLLVRERLKAGDSDAEVIAFLTDRYGEYVLLNPRATGSTLILWLAGPLMLLIAGGIAAVYLRRQSRAPDAADLSDSEKAEVERILRD